MSQRFVVVGAGLAAAKAVEELRAAGFAGPLVMFGDEHHLPYERPPLSKGFLLGDAELETVFVHDPDWYDENEVDLRLGTAVTAIDPGAHMVRTGAGEQPYDRLLLATGSTPRRLPFADASGAPVAYLRTIEDSQRLKGAFVEGSSVLVIGGGWIGLETAAAARTAGAGVTVLESLDLPLLRVLGPEVAKVFADLHREHGVDLRTGVQVSGMDRDGERAVVHLEGGESLTADLVVVGVGVTPNVALAERAGLATDDGVLVDEHLATSDPDVFAIGDIAQAMHPVLGRRIRVEHWDTAAEQGKAVAHSMLGHATSYDRLPYFFTDQYDLGMEYVGSVGPDGYDEVVLRGDTAGRVFTAFWLKDGQVLAGMQVNDWDATEHIRGLVGRAVPADRLRDEDVTLEQLAGSRARMTARVGISGWRYPGWRGDFYPSGLVQRRELEYAASRLTSIEINGSFYSLQRPTSYAAWRAQTPDDFVFSVKGPRYVTHLKRLVGVETALANFFASGVLGLGPKLGPVLWQLPETLRFDAEVLDGFLALLPRSTAAAAALAGSHDDKVPTDRSLTSTESDLPLRHALEFRSADFATGDALEVLRRHRVACVLADTAGRWPVVEQATADLMYVRLHGDRELYASGYTDRALDGWADRCRGWLRDGLDVFVYFDNDVKGFAPYDAMRLIDRLRA